MELEKSNDVLTELYTLRGGLSAISVQYDKARRLDDAYHEKLNTVADQAGGARYEAPRDTVEYAVWLQNGGFENELHKRLNSIKEKEVSDDGADNDNAHALLMKKKSKKHFILFTFFLIGGILALAFAILIVSIMFKGGMKGTFSQNATDAIALIIFFAPSVVALVFSFVFLGKGISEKRLYRKYLTVAQSKKDLAKTEEMLERYSASEQRTRALQNIEKLPLIKSEAQKVMSERTVTIKPMVQSCNVYYKALLAQFSPILDERDWQHLDLIIYELETRRADSIKEALQLVDRELQTERIERTIGEATKAICYTLQRGFSALQQSIQVCCGRICDKLDNISSQLDTMSMQMSVQSMQLAGISGQLAELTDSVNVSNALQAKANVTSAQLCSEVQAMRYYS